MLISLTLACAPAAPRPVSTSGGLVVPEGADIGAAARAVAARARTADVLYLGEAHDNPSHHAGQAAVLEAAVAAGARPVLALEMLPETDQALVDDVLARSLGPEESGRLLRWAARGWPDFAMYWPLLDEARRHGLPVLAADLAPATARLVARRGLGAAGDAGGRLVSALAPDPAREAAIARRIREAHCDLLPAGILPTMVESWHARNVTIARRIAGALAAAPAAAPGPLVVVIIGAGHQAPGGLPDQLTALRPGTRQVIVRFEERGSDDRGLEAGPESDPADVIWMTPAVPRDDPCRALRRPSAPRVPRTPVALGGPTRGSPGPALPT